MSWTDVKNKILSLNPSFYSTLGRKDGNIDLSENSYSMLTQGSMVIGNSIKDPIRLRGYGSTEFDGINDRIITGYGTRRNYMPTPTGENESGWSPVGNNTMAYVDNPDPAGLPGIGKVVEVTYVDTPWQARPNATYELPNDDPVWLTAAVYVDGQGAVTIDEGNSLSGATPIDTTNATTSAQREWRLIRIQVKPDSGDLFGTIRVRVSGSPTVGAKVYIGWMGVTYDEITNPADIFPTVGQLESGAAGWTGTPYASPSDMGAFANGTTRTFTGWAWRETDDTIDAFMGDTTPNDHVRFLLNSGSGVFSFSPLGVSEGGQWNIWPGIGEWVHWALVFDERTDRAVLFINGEEQPERTITAQWPAPLGTLVVASRRTSYAPWHGKMAHVAVFERALTPEEIAEIYDLAINPPPIPFSERDAEIVLLNPEEYGIVALNEEITGFETNTDVNN